MCTVVTASLSPWSTQSSCWPCSLQAGRGLRGTVLTATSRPPPGKCPRQSGDPWGKPAWTASEPTVSKIFYGASKSARRGSILTFRHALIPRIMSLYMSFWCFTFSNAQNLMFFFNEVHFLFQTNTVMKRLSHFPLKISFSLQPYLRSFIGPYLCFKLKGTNIN